MGPFIARAPSREIRPLFCHVDLFAISSLGSRYFRATENFNNFQGVLFIEFSFCFSTFGAFPFFSFGLILGCLWAVMGGLWAPLGLMLGSFG